MTMLQLRQIGGHCERSDIFGSSPSRRSVWSNERIYFALTFSVGPTTVFSGLRAWVLTQNVMMTGLVSMLSLIPFGVNMVGPIQHASQVSYLQHSSQSQFSFGLTGVNEPILGCTVVLQNRVPDALSRS